MKKYFISLPVLFFAIFFLAACGKIKSVPTPAVKTGFTPAIIAQHNTSTDCWLADNSNVYDVTDYLPNFPGGEAQIAAWCGKDATAELNAFWKNLPPSIADQKRQEFENFYLGDLAK
jgi:cytochrome b involved in lipid metabolism